MTDRRAAFFFMLWALCAAELAHGDGVKPAVGGLNAKLELDAGSVDGGTAFFAAGSLTAPMGSRLGFQLDAARGEMERRDAAGLATHLFFRDPDRHLLGLTAYTLDYRNRSVDRVGLEGERYLGHWTLGAVAGHQGGDLGDDLFYGLKLKNYPNANSALKATVDVHGDRRLFGVGAEWQAGPGWAMVVEGGTADGNDYLLAGARLYFGKNKSLRGRHREDDPENPLLNALMAIKHALDEQGVSPPATGAVVEEEPPPCCPQ